MSARVAVIGATGYVGGELATLLLRHPGIARPNFFVRDRAARVRDLADVFPQLAGWAQAPCETFSVEKVAATAPEMVFLATPHEVSLDLVPQLGSCGLRVIDLSGAYRFRNGQHLEKWYGLKSNGNEWQSRAVYGLPELYSSEIRQAQIVANPGCYPTSVILGLLPLVEACWLARERGVVCDCKSGASGAGKELKPEMHFVELEGNFRAYNLFHHRHTPEILEHLNLQPSDVVFSTHLLPVRRGILSTLYVWLEQPRTLEQVEELYRNFYRHHRLVRIRPGGELPELKYVVGTNFCDLGFALDESGEQLIVVSCLDNLGKGAAGQAIQNLNLMLGHEEVTGLL